MAFSVLGNRKSDDPVIMLLSMSNMKETKEQVKIRLVVEFENYVCLCPYELREVPKTAGFWWDSRRKAWTTNSASKASGLIKFADREARERILDKLNGAAREQREWIPAKVGKYGNRG